MFQNICQAVGFFAQHFENLRPFHRTFADVAPAVLIEVLAPGRNVLDMGRGDAVAIGLQPFHRVLFGAGNPRHINFPIQQFAALKNAFMGGGAVFQFRKFKVVIMPTENITFVTVLFSSATQALAEFFPACAGFGTLVGHDIRAIEGAHAKGLGDVQHSLFFLLEHVDGEEVSRWHGEAVLVEKLTEFFRLVIEGTGRAIGAAKAFHFRVARLGQHRDNAIPGLEVSGGIELE